MSFDGKIIIKGQSVIHHVQDFIGEVEELHNENKTLYALLEKKDKQIERYREWVSKLQKELKQYNPNIREEEVNHENL